MYAVSSKSNTQRFDNFATPSTHHSRSAIRVPINAVAILPEAVVPVLDNLSVCLQANPDLAETIDLLDLAVAEQPFGSHE